MSDKAIQLSYDEAARRAVLTFPNGRELALRDVSEAQAREFMEKHAPEFQRRDCCLTSVDGAFVRENGNGE